MPIDSLPDGRLYQPQHDRPGAVETPLVLVVDDEPGIRALITDSIAADGQLRVVEAADGLAALRRIAEERPALVLFDLTMPVLNGFDLCRRLKADPATRDLPAVAVSAGRNRTEALAAGADDFLAKPFDLDALDAMVARWLPRG